MKAVLHIGIGKAGTSSIQAFLDNNRSLLKSIGVFYPKDLHRGRLGGDNQKGLAMICSKFRKEHIFFRQQSISSPITLDAYKKKVISAYRLQLQQNRDARIAVVSAEHFWSELTNIDDISRLRDLLEEIGLHVIHIVMHVRNQYEWLESFIHQKHRESSKVDSFQKLGSAWIRSRLDYAATHHCWTSIFRDSQFSIRAVSSERLFLKDGSLLLDFLTFCRHI